MGNQSHRHLQTHTNGQRKTSSQGRRVHGNGNAEGEEPRASRRYNPGPPGAGPTPAGGSSTAETPSKRGTDWMATQTPLITKG